MENDEQECGEILSNEEMEDNNEQLKSSSSSPPSSTTSSSSSSSTSPTNNEKNIDFNELNLIYKDFQQQNKDYKDNIIKFYNKRKENDKFFKVLKSYISTSINSKQLNFLTSIYDTLYKNDKTEIPFEYFIEIIYIVSINDTIDPSYKLSSILFFSKYFNKSENNENELFSLLLLLLKFENKSSIIVNNIIQFLGSILSLSISLGMYYILKLTYNWLIDFKNQSITTTTKTEVLNQVINNLNNLNKVERRDVEEEKENNTEKVDNLYISTKLLDILINDHLILNESSNNFENLPCNSFDFSSLLTTIMLSHYLNPFNRTKSNNNNNNNINNKDYIEFTIIPKLLSLLSNYWLFQKPQLLLKSNEKQSKSLNNINILKEIITISIFSNYINDDNENNDNIKEKNELVEPYIIKLNTMLLNTMYQISECKHDNFSNLIIENISNTLNPSFFSNIITKINNLKNNSNNNNKPIDRLSQIIQIYSKTCKRFNPDYLNTHIQLLKQLNFQTQLSKTILNQ